MPSLDSICQEVALVAASLDDAPEDQREALEAQVKEYIERDLALPGKVDAVAAYIRQLDAEAEYLEGRAEELSGKAKAARRRMESFKGYVRAAMANNGLHKLKGREATLSLRKSERVEIEDASKVPSDYKMETVTTTVMKGAIRAAILLGEDVPGARLVQGESLQVR